MSIVANAEGGQDLLFSYKGNRCHATIVSSIPDDVIDTVRFYGKIDGYSIYQLPTNGWFNEFGFYAVKESKGMLNKIVDSILEGKSLTEAIQINESVVDEDKVTVLLHFLDLSDTEANRSRVSTSSYNDNIYTIDGDNDFLICTDDEADEEHHDAFMSLVDDLGLDSFSPSAQYYIISNFADEDSINEFYQDGVKSYAEDINNESETVTIQVENPKTGEQEDVEVVNRLFKECLENNIISDDDFTTEDFNEDGEYIGDTDLVELYCDHFQTPVDQGYDNGFDWLKWEFGKDFANKFIRDNDAINWDAACEWVKSEDGRGNELNGWDGKEYEEAVAGETYYIYPDCDFKELKGKDVEDDADNIDTGEE